MSAENVVVVGSVIAGLLVALKFLMKHLGESPKLVFWVMTLMIIALVVLSSMLLNGCRASVPVLIKNYQCQISATSDGEGGIQMTCIEEHGNTNVESGGSPGDSAVDVSPPNP